MPAYSSAGWGDFLVAAAGATAALAGLVFVGISINLTRILTLPGVSGRAGKSIVVLANALAITLVALAPGLSRVTLGVAVLLIGAAAMAATILITVRSATPERRQYRVNDVVMSQLATTPFVVAGISLLAEVGGGLYWLMAGVVLSLLVGLGNGWVLLVEILR